MTDENIISQKTEKRKSNASNSSNKGNNYNFHINNSKENKNLKFKKNTVTTTKYNIFTFLPKTLLYQYIRPEKVYYLIMIILENIPTITPIIPVSTMVPYFIVLIISIIREGVEDYLRYKYDKELNNERTTVYRNDSWEETTTEDLRVGEIVLIKKNTRFPADLLLIDSDKDEGVAFIETSSLDGEISLKKKFSPLELAGIVNQNGNYRQKIKNIQGVCKCEEPNVEIFRFNGVLELNIEDKSRFEIAVSNSQMLLKGAVLKSNEWAVGFVTYAGHNTKLIKNLSKPKQKESKVFKLMTIFVMYVFIIQSIFCWISAGLNYNYHSHFIQQIGNVPKFVPNPTRDSVLSYFSYLIIYKFMIPITLYVTFELVRIIQAYLLWVNTDLYSHYKHKQLSVGTVSIIEELGAVNYVFTDKTGTLTCNKMEMKFCVIGDKCYEFLHKNIFHHFSVQAEHRQIIPMPHNYFEGFLKSECLLENTQKWKFSDYKIVCNSNNNIELKFEKESDLISEYWKALALAHECVAEEGDKGHDFIGLSPDDVVLVKSASKQGFILQKMDKASCKKVNIMGVDKEFEILNTFEFTSDRKRLSVIVRDNGLIKMYIKGADSVIKKILTNKTKEEFSQEADYFIDLFSKRGLRTLYVGMKLIEEQDYNEWKVLWEKANKNLADKMGAVKRAQDMIEKDIHLLGATIVEDKLQDDVPETIKELRLAGIKIWMITGDKMDTAYNIGISCNLISKDIQTFFVKGEDGHDLNKLRSEYIAFQESYKTSNNLQNYSIVLDSLILSEILDSEATEKEFIEISNKAVSVICCRVSPMQKSDIVRIMKKYHPGTVSLAIGDGGNDVSMILEAHLGVGIYGEEGLRAVQSADFAIGEFKILRNLLLVHGRQCHIRMNNMILCYFYKCYIFCLVHFLYGFYNCFSAQTIYDDWLITFYNIGFTFFPIVVKAYTDWDIRPDDGTIIYELNAYLYKENRDNPIMNYVTYYWEFVRGFVHCIVNFFFCIYSLNNEILGTNGYQPDLWYLATILYFNMITVGTVRLIVTTRNIVSMYIISIVLTTFCSVGIALVGLHYSLNSRSSAVMAVEFGSSWFYLISFLVCGTCLALDLIEESIFSLFGKSLANRLMLLIKENGKINHPEILPNDIKRLLGNYQGEQTELQKKDVIEMGQVVNMYGELPTDK